MASLNDIAVEHLLNAYAHGVFPMAASAHTSELYLQDPDWRGIIPLDRVHVPRRLARTVRNTELVVRINSDFEAVIAACAEETPDRGSTWINREIRQLYAALFQRGHCHTVEVWSDTRLVGGLYGVSLKGAFFGESMFSRTRDASKIALVHLCARLLAGGYVLLDTQFSTPHLEQFGTEEIPRRVFQAKLQRALAVDAEFLTLDCAATGAEAIDIIRSAQRRSAG